jgi:GntR family transcriptional regulator
MDEEAIDLMGPEPLKIQIAQVIERRITDGTYPPRRAIPGELGLAAEFSVSRNTVREAVRILRERGVLLSVRGKGNFVCEQADEDSETGSDAS